MLWLQSSISTVAHELWYSPCTTIRSSCFTWIREVRGATCEVRGAGAGVVRARARFALDRVEQRARRIEVQRVAELVRLRRAGRLDAGRLLARVVAAVAALAERSEQIAQRAVAEKIERLVGDLEGRPAADPVPGRRRVPDGARARPRDPAAS